MGMKTCFLMAEILKFIEESIRLDLNYEKILDLSYISSDQRTPHEALCFRLDVENKFAKTQPMSISVYSATKTYNGSRVVIDVAWDIDLEGASRSTLLGLIGFTTVYGARAVNASPRTISVNMDNQNVTVHSSAGIYSSSPLLEYDNDTCTVTLHHLLEIPKEPMKFQDLVSKLWYTDMLYGFVE